MTRHLIIKWSCSPQKISLSLPLRPSIYFSSSISYCYSYFYQPQEKKWHATTRDTPKLPRRELLHHYSRLHCSLKMRSWWTGSTYRRTGRCSMYGANPGMQTTGQDPGKDSAADWRVEEQPTWCAEKSSISAIVRRYLEPPYQHLTG